MTERRDERGEGSLAAQAIDPYWRRRVLDQVDSPPLQTLAHPCHDCAVVCGFYEEFSEVLSREPAPVQRFVADRWFCHNASNRRCQGNVEFLDRAAAIRSL